MTTFCERYCVVHRISADKFDDAVLRQTLHSTAKAVRWLLVLIPEYFAADYEFIRSVGRLQRLEDFENETFDFRLDSRNRGFLRRGLKLRVSARRLQTLVRATMRDGDGPGQSAPVP